MEPPGVQARHLPKVVPGERHQQPLFEDLLDRYAREFSRFHPVQFDGDGRFAYPDLASYWREPERFPFLIWLGDSVAGFALVRRIGSATGDDPEWDVTEFFVTEKFRRNGVGRNAVFSIWRRFPGRWQVRILAANTPAVRFWERAVGEFTIAKPGAVPYDVNGEAWLKFRFDSRTAGDR